MIRIYLRIFKNGASSWRTNRRSKVVTGANILPPVTKRMELQKRPLEVSKDFDEISPSFEVLFQSIQSFERPSVRFHWALNRGPGVGGDVVKWIFQGSLQGLPFDCELVQQIWVDDMDAGIAGMSLPH